MIARQILFLFSALGAINGVFMAGCFLTRRPRRLADCLLGALLLAVGVRTAKSVFLYFNPTIALEFRQLGLSACLLIGPLTYLYVRTQLAERAHAAAPHWRRHLGMGFLLIGAGVAFPYAAYPEIWDVSSQAIHLFWLGYLVAAGKALWDARGALFQPQRRMTADTLLLLSVYLGSCAILLAYATVPFTSYIVGALSFTFSLHIAVMVLFLRLAPPAGADAKYRNNKLGDSDALVALAAVESVMREQALYLNPT